MEAKVLDAVRTRPSPSAAMLSDPAQRGEVERRMQINYVTTLHGTLWGKWFASFRTLAQNCTSSVVVSGRKFFNDPMAQSMLSRDRKHMDKHDRPYKCQKPGCELLLGFTYSGGLLRHQREVHGEHGGRKKVLHCPKENCKRHSGSGFTREENLAEHMRRVHRVDLATPDSKSQYDAFASSVSSAGSAMSPGSDVVPFGSYRRDRKAHRQDAISLQEENAGLNIRIKKMEDELHDLKNLIRELQSPLDGFVGGKRKRSRESSPAAGIIENPSTDSEGRSILHRASFDTMETSSHPDGSAPSQHMVLALDCHAESATRDLVKGVGRPSHVKFQCTFCRLQLTEKAWKRHEEKQHLPRSQWTCMAQGSRYERNGESECVFCQSTSNVDQLQHQGCHRIADCMAKPKRERTFTRRDNLIQHLKGFHQAIPCEEVIASWEFQADHSHHAWSCGFCGETLDDWDTRAAHTAKHFRNGITMSSWDSNRVTGDEDEKESEALLIVPMTSPFLLKHQSDRSAESTRDGDLLDLDGTNIDAAGSGTNQVPCDNVTWTALQKDPGLTLQSTDHGYWPPEPDPSYLMGLEMDIPMPDSESFADFGNVEEWFNVDFLDNTEATIDLAANADSQSIFSPAVDTACVPETEDGLSEFREGLDGWEELPRTSNEEVIRPAGDEEDLAAELVATKVKLQKLESELSKVKQVEVMYYYAMGT